MKSIKNKQKNKKQIKIKNLNSNNSKDKSNIMKIMGILRFIKTNQNNKSIK